MEKSKGDYVPNVRNFSRIVLAKQIVLFILLTRLLNNVLFQFHFEGFQYQNITDWHLFRK